MGKELTGRMLAIATDGGGLKDPAVIKRYRELWQDRGFDLPDYVGTLPLPETETEPQKPRLARRVLNYGEAVVKHVIAGAKHATSTEASRRESVCRSNICGYFRASDATCADCGCPLRNKTAWSEQRCPLGLWDSPSLSDVAAYNGPTAVGITTAPRSKPTVSACVRSVIKTGWQPVLFAEPNSLAPDTPVPIIQRGPKSRGAWRNWLETCRNLLGLFPAAEKILIIQDDAEFVPGCRDLVENMEWPQGAAFVSLYTPRQYTYDFQVMDSSGKLVQVLPNLEQTKPFTRRGGFSVKQVQKPNGLNRIYTRSLWGACALVLDRQFAQQLVLSSTAKNWRGFDGKQAPEKAANIDTAVGKIANLLKRPMYFTLPSCVEHIAEVSTLGHGKNGDKRRAEILAEHASEVLS